MGLEELFSDELLNGPNPRKRTWLVIEIPGFGRTPNRKRNPMLQFLSSLVLMLPPLSSSVVTVTIRKDSFLEGMA